MGTDEWRSLYSDMSKVGLKQSYLSDFCLQAVDGQVLLVGGSINKTETALKGVYQWQDDTRNFDTTNLMAPSFPNFNSLCVSHTDYEEEVMIKPPAMNRLFL